MTQKHIKFNKRIKSAFTMIELAMVLLVIALLVGGIVGGQSLIQSAQLAKARSLTQSAPVMNSEDLTLWLETVLEQD